MSMTRLGAGVCAVALIVGCGGTKPAPTPTAPSTIEAPPSVAPGPLGPVSAPAELFAVARVSSASKVVDTVVGWSSLPVDWRRELGREAPGFDRIAVLDAPIDFCAMLDPASSLDPKILWAFAFGAASTDLAASFFRQQGGHVVNEGGGSYRIRLGSDLVCIALPALGVAAARVVCSEEAVGAETLAPYMARGLPTEVFGRADVHAHLLAGPFRKRFGSQLALVRTVGVPFALREIGLDHSKFDRALGEALYALADEVIALANDLDRIEAEASLAPGIDAIDVSASLVLSGQRSWWSGTMARAAAGHATGAPEFFWKLPGDATAASYSTYSDPERARPLAAALGRVVDGWLDYHRLSEARRAALVTALEAALDADRKSAYAALPAAASPPALDTSGELRGFLRAAIGGHVLGLEGDGVRVQRLASEIVKTLGDRTFRDHLTKTKVLPEGTLPIAREHPPRQSKGLPAGTQVFELEFPPAALEPASKGKGPKATAATKRASRTDAQPFVAVLVVAPDADVTWIAFGTEERVLEERIAAIRAGTAGSLATREGLTSLRSEPALSAGFSSLAGALAGLPADARSRAPLLDRAPHRGETPVVWKVTVDGRGPAVAMAGRIPRALVEDVIAVGVSQIPRAAAAR